MTNTTENTAAPAPMAEVGADALFILRHQADGSRWPAGTKLFAEQDVAALQAVNAALFDALKAAQQDHRTAERQAIEARGEAERLRRRVRELDGAGFQLTARLCGVGVVGEIDGHEVVRRSSVMEFVTRWRAQRDEAATAA